MRILIAVDKHEYSGYIIQQASALAENTWAEITLLGIHGAGLPNSENALVSLSNTLDTYRRAFIHHFKDMESPYGPADVPYQLMERKKSVFDQVYEGPEGRKNFNVRIRCGNAGKEILAESVESDTDLIVIGCAKGQGCKWIDDADVQHAIVKDAQCSVLVIKEDKEPQMIVCCLDHDQVSQASVELINQLVTFYKVDLELVGVTEKNRLKDEVDHKMAQIVNHYADCDIRAWVKLVDAPSLNSFVVQSAEKNLVVLWMGKESFLDKIFSRQRLAQLAATAESSMLILR